MLKHIGGEFDSIIAADITGDEAGARKVNLGDAYKGLKLGNRAATTVFLYSFSGGSEQGATLGEIKRSAVTTGIPSSVVAEAATDLQNKLFYLRREDGRFFFTNQPNLNRILLTRMENIKDSEIKEFEKTLVKRNLSIGNLNTFIWPSDGLEVTDSADLKLVILKQPDNALMQAILEMRGKSRRVNRNTLFFLTTLVHERGGFYGQLKKTIAYRAFTKDATLNLSNEQQREARNELSTAENSLDDMLHRYYRTLFIPTRDGFREADLGVPTFGATKKLDEVVFENLRSNSEILEKIAPVLLRERYLRDNEAVSTQQMYQSSAKTPGSLRVVSRSVWESSISEGVRRGIFGLGELQGGEPVCQYFKQPSPLPAFIENEVIIQKKICIAQKGEKTDPEGGNGDGTEKGDEQSDTRTRVHLQFRVPQGGVSPLLEMMNYLQLNFNTLQLELTATDGEMSEQDYEDKIKEALDQLGIDSDSATRT